MKISTWISAKFSMAMKLLESDEQQVEWYLGVVSSHLLTGTNLQLGFGSETCWYGNPYGINSKFWLNFLLGADIKLTDVKSLMQSPNCEELSVNCWREDARPELQSTSSSNILIAGVSDTPHALFSIVVKFLYWVSLYTSTPFIKIIIVMVQFFV